jgi:DNA-binding transcriptional MerR regulator
MGKKKDLSIGEAAKVCEVSAKQLRHWQEKGYLPAPERVVCGVRSYRKYGEQDLDLIKKIKAYQDKGFTLPVAAEKATGKNSTKEGKNND